jgi:hypothetical protein
MGMDVFGKNPKSKTGAQFSRTVWGWRPLWDYMEDLHGDIVYGVDGHTNSGSGLNAQEAERLGKAILVDIDNNAAQTYLNAREQHLLSLPREECSICDGTGIRTDSIGVEMGQHTKQLDPTQALVLGRAKGWCNGCDGMGDKEAWAASYHVNLDDLVEFAEFLLECGGFEIC